MTASKNGVREAIARKQGYRLGLRMAYNLVLKAKQYQSLKVRVISEEKDPDLHGEFEHGASVLHALGLRLQEEIRKAGD